MRQGYRSAWWCPPRGIGFARAMGLTRSLTVGEAAHYRWCVDLNSPAVIGPVQQCLALALAAGKITWLAIALNLAHMPSNSFPAADLASIFFRPTATHVVAAVPLEPAAGISWMYPAFPAPL